MGLLTEILGIIKPVIKWLKSGLALILPFLGTFTGQLLMFVSLSITIFQGLVSLSETVIENLSVGVDDFSVEIDKFLALPVWQSDYFHFLVYITGLDVYFHTTLNLISIICSLLLLLFSISFIATMTFVLAGFGVRAIAKVISVFLPTSDI